DARCAPVQGARTLDHIVRADERRSLELVAEEKVDRAFDQLPQQIGRLRDDERVRNGERDPDALLLRCLDRCERSPPGALAGEQVAFHVQVSTSLERGGLYIGRV